MKGAIKGKHGAETYWLDGQQVTREAFDQAFPNKPLCGQAPGGHNPACWPMQSDALAVHPTQIAEAMERDRKRGLCTEYNPEDGRMILKDRGQRRDVLRSLGFHDNQGGFGD